MNEHTQEQGLRVHHLVNLGGLIAVAGLDREPPDFLLGRWSASLRARRADPEQRAQVASLGRQKLDERATAKRAWKSWRRARDQHPLTLSSAQMRRLIAALGGTAPEDPERLVPMLTELLKEQDDAVAAVEAGRG